MQGVFSPLQRLFLIGQHLNIDLRTMRDDLFPMTGGGNKARKIIKILQSAENQGCNALVTTGGIQSNHGRVTALAAAQRGWRCKLILHGDKKEVANPKGNLLLILLAGAEIEIVQPDEIASAMQSAMDAFRSQGLTPCEIPGGGHSVTGAMAFVEAVDELKEQCQPDGWQADWVILASGTGTTQAGLIVGLERLGWQTKVLGISVARHNPRGKDIVEESCRELRSHLGLPSRTETIDFRDDWVGEGYEQAGTTVLSAISTAAAMEGLILDPTYTGKAFAALLDLVHTGEIAKNSKVLFWHTGGLLNIMASNYFSGIKT
ncbi:1-aminocyclopropane-1-carboxylate deaminase/D-cysteine desulfhydrase [Nostoc sp. NMS8]|uniref:1-aminocyclopropane-1-carboxylate deaminase/D-cysteine desulfhydrase n=1 Tax=Nostoc sp. NMS8 TaxID=2815392 RepID=UPI0025D26890|nr:pyridoxal-phosphate dependent enzyme [Nostoc sp. NMS8]